MSYVGTHSRHKHAGHFAQLSRTIIPKPLLNGEVKQAIKLLPRKGSTGGSLAGITRLVKHNKSIAEFKSNS